MAAELSDTELRQIVENVTWENFNGHAYSSKSLRELRNLLRISEEKWPDKTLHRHTDEIVALIGPALFVARKDTGKDTVKQLEGKLLRPAEKFLSALESPDFQLQFWQPWSDMKSNIKDELAENMRDFIDKLNGHIAEIRHTSKKGQPWDSELKDQFVQYVDYLCEFLNPEIEPRRAADSGLEDHSNFGKCVYLLAHPLIWGAQKGRDIKFHGAIRKYVDWWRAAVIETKRKLKEERSGRER